MLDRNAIRLAIQAAQNNLEKPGCDTKKVIQTLQQALDVSNSKKEEAKSTLALMLERHEDDRQLYYPKFSLEMIERLEMEQEQEIRNLPVSPVSVTNSNLTATTSTSATTASSPRARMLEDHAKERAHFATNYGQEDLERLEYEQEKELAEIDKSPKYNNY